MTQILSDHVELVPVSELKPHPRNPRKGNVDVIAASIQANGFAGALLVQRSTGHVIAGNHRLKAAIKLGMTEVPVMYVDVSDEQALRILLADNRTSDTATNDEQVLTFLLSELATTPEALSGTAFSADDLADMLVGSASNGEPNPPAAFKEFDSDLQTEYQCPSCKYVWSGKPKP